MVARGPEAAAACLDGQAGQPGDAAVAWPTPCAPAAGAGKPETPPAPAPPPRTRPQAAAAAEPEGGAEEELEGAESLVKEAESSGKVDAGGKATWSNLLEVGTLVFLAEWGDRSMLATIALAVAQNPFGVAVGATAGHAAATAIAVVGGAIAGQHVSERTVNAVSGVLFLLFAAATVFSML